MSIVQSDRFVHVSRLAFLDLRAPVAEGFALLDIGGIDGFILVDDVAPRWYCPGTVLQQTAKLRAGEESALAENVLTGSIAELFGLRISEEFGWSGQEDTASGLTPVGTEVVPAGADGQNLGPLQDRDDTVFPVLDPRGRLWGWFLNHETIPTPDDRGSSYICPDGHRTAKSVGACPFLTGPNTTCGKRPMKPVSTP